MAMILDFFGNVFGYIGNYFAYYLWSCTDLIWKPIAMMINGMLGVVEAFVNLILTLFAWSNITFSYFMVALVLIFIFGLLIRLLIFLKEVILRWA